MKTGIDLSHFGLESGMVFEGTTALRKYLSFCFNSKYGNLGHSKWISRNLVVGVQN